MEITPYALAQRYVGIAEISGETNHPLVSWWLSLCGFNLQSPDEIPWCSAFVNGICWELRLPRSKSAAARSWLNVGAPISITAAQVGFDVVVLSRGTNVAQGHVGFYAGQTQEGGYDRVQLLGGNQHNTVCVESFEKSKIVGVRRLL